MKSSPIPPPAARTPKAKGGETSKDFLRGMSSSLGLEKRLITKHMTPSEAAAVIAPKVGAPKLRGALMSRGLPNTGGHVKKVEAVLAHEHQND